MEKINKIKAKKLFEQGFIIRVVPNKLSPDNKEKIYRDIRYFKTNMIQKIVGVYCCNNFDFVISNYKDTILNFENGYYFNYYIKQY